MVANARLTANKISTQEAAASLPTWAVALLVDMKRRKAAARPVVFSARLQAAATRQQRRQQTKGYGYAFGARKFTGAW